MEELTRACDGDKSGISERSGQRKGARRRDVDMRDVEDGKGVFDIKSVIEDGSSALTFGLSAARARTDETALVVRDFGRGRVC